MPIKFDADKANADNLAALKQVFNVGQQAPANTSTPKKKQAAPAQSQPATPPAPDDLNTIPGVEAALKAGHINQMVHDALVGHIQARAQDNSNMEEHIQKQNLFGRGDWDNAVDNFKMHPLPGVQTAEDATDNIQDQISNIQKMPLKMNGVDMRPLGALLDQWYGGNLAATTPAPETPEDRAKLLTALNEKLADNAAKQTHYGVMGIEAQQIKNPSQFVMMDKAGNRLTTTDTNNNKLDASFIHDKPKGAGNGGKDWYQNIKDFTKMAEGPQQTLKALQVIDGLIPGGIDNWNGKSIPGAGLGSSISQMTTADRRAMGEAIANLRMGLAHEYFGARITPPEIANLNKALGLGGIQTDAQFVQGMRMAREKATEALREAQMMAGAGKAGGQASAYLKAQGQVAPPAGSTAGAMGTVNTPGEPPMSALERLRRAKQQ